MGTYVGEQIQSSQFQSYNDIFDDTSGDAGIDLIVFVPLHMFPH